MLEIFSSLQILATPIEQKTNCDVLQYRSVVLESNLNQDCVEKMLYRLVQE